MNLLEKVQRESLPNVPQFAAGDSLRIHTKVKEGDKERIQIFEGVVIRRKGQGRESSFTVRKVSYGIGVELIFPLFSPTIAKIEIATRGKVRRAKLYYLRKLSGKKARIEVGESFFDNPENSKPSEAAAS